MTNRDDHREIICVSNYDKKNDDGAGNGDHDNDDDDDDEKNTIQLYSLTLKRKWKCCHMGIFLSQAGLEVVGVASVKFFCQNYSISGIVYYLMFWIGPGNGLMLIS